MTTNQQFNISHNSYPLANSINILIKEYFKADQEIQILEKGAYPGLFARFFLLSAKETGDLWRMHYKLMTTKKEQNEMESKELLKIEDASYNFFENDGEFKPNVVLINNLYSNLSHENAELAIIFDTYKEEVNADDLFYSSEYLNFSIQVIPKEKDKLSNTFNKIFHETNNIEVYSDLIMSLNSITCPYSLNVYKLLLEELTNIDGFSALNFFFIGKFYQLQGKPELAKENFELAKTLDFYGSLG